MNRLQTMALRLILASLVLLCFAGEMQAQTPASQESKKPADTKTDTKKAEEDPFAPEPAPPLPAGMTGSEANDPRTNRTRGRNKAAKYSWASSTSSSSRNRGRFNLTQIIQTMRK